MINLLGICTNITNMSSGSNLRPWSCQVGPMYMIYISVSHESVTYPGYIHYAVNQFVIFISINTGYV